MTTRSKKHAEKVALVSTPWPLYDRPSIQIGTLKAYLQSQFADLQVDAHHAYLILAESIGYKLYHQISERTWLAESIYAALLFPERFQRIEKLFHREAGRKSVLTDAGLKKITAQIKTVTDAFISSHNWGDYMLVGFTVCLCQLTSTLYFIKHIKQKCPFINIVVGGSAFSGEAAGDLLKIFPEIDIVVNGEGELPLSQLIGHLKDSKDLSNVPPIQGIYRQPGIRRGINQISFFQLENLKRLPAPDYDEFFDLMKTFRLPKMFFPTLPVESSRGCWWQRKTDTGKASGCAFCNLNLQWQGYRSKQPSQVVAEIDHLTGRYKSLSISFVDNVLPKKTSREIFEKLLRLNKDFHLFSEIRASTSWHELEIMCEAGMQEVQIGIEALSTRLLKKLHKGTSAIQNLEIMRNCEALGVVNSSNLILHFPGSDAQDVEETLRNLEFALAYRPLKPVGFWLGFGSPVWQNPNTYRIKTVYNHPNWACLFPPEIFQSIRFSIQACRGDRSHQKKIWQPVKKAVKRWQNNYTELHKGFIKSPILSFRDGRNFLIIRQRRARAEALNHRLEGTSRQIYLFCRKHRSIRRIRDEFPSFPEDKILAFLKMMVDKKLMFEEDDKYLSLAVPIKPKNLKRINLDQE